MTLCQEWDSNPRLHLETRILCYYFNGKGLSLWSWNPYRISNINLGKYGGVHWTQKLQNLTLPFLCTNV